jgi:lipopolysaccharide biosynthesis regulator YciM
MDKRRLIVFLYVSLMFAGLFFLYPQAESFYLKTLTEGKTYYHQGRYQQAINQFKIAEFGLLEEKEYLAELYLYYALSYFKLGKINECREILKTLKTELKVKEPDNITAPPQIADDWKLMLATLNKYDTRSKEKGGKNIIPILVKNFEEGFQKALHYLKNNDLPGLDNEIKGLMRIDKKDVRISYLRGIAEFKKKKYSKCIGYLEKITDLIDPVYKDDVFYYLSLSYYFLNKKEQAILYSQRVYGKNLREELDEILVSPSPGTTTPKKDPPKSIPEQTTTNVELAEKSPQISSPSTPITPSTEKNIEPGPAAKLENSFDSIFLEILEKVKKSRYFELEGVEENLKKLENIDKRDVRVLFLKGLMVFKEKKYKNCSKILEKVGNTIDPTLRNDVYYYLALSYYFMKNWGQTLAVYQKIDNQENREQLDLIIQKVMEERNRLIGQISRNFSFSGLNELIKQFPGDPTLCTDILDAAIKANTGAYSINNIIAGCIKKAGAYNEAFILMAVDYLVNNQEIKSAIKIIKKSKFYKNQDPGQIEIQYKLGELYLEDHDLEKALIQMTKVKAIQDNYKKTDYIIKTINNLIYNSSKNRRKQ